MSTYFSNTITECDRTFYLYSDSGLTTTADAGIFNIDSSTGIVTISSSDTSYSGNTYTLYVTSVLTANDPDSKASSLLTIEIEPCKLEASIFEYKVFTVNSNPVGTYTFPAFTTDGCLPDSLIYTGTYSGLSLPNWIDIDSSSRTVTVRATTNSLKGSHKIKIFGKATYNNGVSYTAFAIFTFFINPENTMPPQFRSALQDQIVTANTYEEYILPSLYDIDTDGWTMLV